MVFEKDHEAADIDVFRAGVLRHWTARAEALLGQQQKWLQGRAVSHVKLLATVHGPLVKELCEAMSYEDELLFTHLGDGFPYAGALPCSLVATKPGGRRPSAT